jgi:tRNA pseudouridine38-40 synthase
MSKNLNRNLKVIISYNGSAYHGFQRQANALTVQEIVESALTKLLKHDVHITGCSRTDAGVHAREFCFNVRTSTDIPDDGFVRGLNALLPPDIAAQSCEEVCDNFHARYDAKSKEYAYLIRIAPIRDVFTQNLAYHYHSNRSLDLELMNKAATLFTGEHDFSAYCKAESLEITRAKKRGTVREIYDIRLQFDGNLLSIVICGNGFLHNMVRIMAGTLLYVGEGKLTLADVQKSLLEGSNRTDSGKTLPACGLYLNKVYY